MSAQNSEQFVSLVSTIRRSEDHLAAKIDNELVLMSGTRGNYYGLNAIGADIWQRLGEPIVVSNLCVALTEDYNADNETISRDVLALLEHMASEGLIEVLP